jgi:hypothetical protein
VVTSALASPADLVQPRVLYRDSRGGAEGEQHRLVVLGELPAAALVSEAGLPQVLFRLPIEIDALPELPLDAAAELDGPGDAELPLELPGVLQREATRRRPISVSRTR